jgi:hypothetical protein
MSGSDKPWGKIVLVAVAWGLFVILLGLLLGSYYMDFVDKVS